MSLSLRFLEQIQEAVFVFLEESQAVEFAFELEGLGAVLGDLGEELVNPTSIDLTMISVTRRSNAIGAGYGVLLILTSQANCASKCCSNMG